MTVTEALLLNVCCISAKAKVQVNRIQTNRSEIVKILITEEAFQWFKDEFDLEKDDYMRIFVRYGGCGSFQQGFSLGVIKDSPKQAATTLLVNGVTFFVEEEDLWYFENKNIKLDFNKAMKEIEFVPA